MHSNSLPLCLRMSGFCSEKLLWRTTIRWDGGRSFFPGTSHARAREIFWVFASKSGSSLCRLPWKLVRYATYVSWFFGFNSVLRFDLACFCRAAPNSCSMKLSRETLPCAQATGKQICFPCGDKANSV